MPRYVIEREMPDIGTAEREALRDASAASASVLAEMNAEHKAIQWEHSYVAADKVVCVFLAGSDEYIHEHARRTGLPATDVSRVIRVIDPVTAEG
jgi:Protein of unknown function (DUF4242)